MSNFDLPVYSQYPILLDKQHHIARIIIRDAHECLLHAGVKETLTEVRSSFWLVLGRLFVHHIIHDCVICRKSEGRPYQGVPPPPLLEFHVKWLSPFQFTGVDFAGPLYVKSSPKKEGRKAWLCLYTCAVDRAVHLTWYLISTHSSFWEGSSVSPLLVDYQLRWYLIMARHLSQPLRLFMAYSLTLWSRNISLISN